MIGTEYLAIAAITAWIRVKYKINNKSGIILVLHLIE